MLAEMAIHPLVSQIQTRHFALKSNKIDDYLIDLDCICDRLGYGLILIVNHTLVTLNIDIDR
jgi:hypothetical protein